MTTVLHFVAVSFDCHVLLCVLCSEYTYREISEVLGDLNRECNIISIAVIIPFNRQISYFVIYNSSAH